eukprot:2984826-Prymnesium_polylepis.1
MVRPGAGCSGRDRSIARTVRQRQRLGCCFGRASPTHADATNRWQPPVHAVVVPSRRACGGGRNP